MDESKNSPWEFRRHVLPILSKAGCNTGACHGALAGKGGFKLSLRGYNPAGDHYQITRAARGRRIELSDPGRSLILAKPSGFLPHKGGLKLDVESADYKILAEWIQAGAPGPSDADPTIERIEVSPELASLKVGDEQSLSVKAIYSDGRVEDVSKWAKFSSTNETVIKVSDDGTVKVIGNGEGSVVCWFSSQIVLARMVSPFNNSIDPKVYQSAERRNFIDELVLQKLKTLRLAPSEMSSDEEFVRRVFLDAIGVLPTVEEVTNFLGSDSPTKRDDLIDQLLSRDEYVDFWTHKWSDLLLINGRRLRPKPVKAYYHWLRKRVEDNMPWDQLVREIVTAKGSSVENGATNFFALHQDPESMTENVSQAFLGLSIGCAKCHNHPLEKWTNDQYYAMASHFSRVKAKGWGGDGRGGDGLRTLFVSNQGELIQPLTGKPQPPTPLDGEPIPFDQSGDRREHLADWLTSPENPYFSRAITNRVWASFFGVGIVESVDDLRVSNPPSNGPLLNELSNYLVAKEFDLKQLMRLIMQSATYQRSSKPIVENADDKRFFSRYYPRRLTAEVLLDAIAQVTEVPTEFTQIGFDGNDFAATTEYPKGTRAIELYDSAVVSNFLKTFGRNERDITCECERSNTPSMVQVLHISNGVTINDRLSKEESCVGKAMAMEAADELISNAYLKALSRNPTQTELEGLGKLIDEADPKEKKLLVEDLFWSIMSSREFLFNH